MQADTLIRVLPGGMPVSIRYPQPGLTTVSAILAIPSAARGIWDGPEPIGEDPGGMSVHFDLGWHADLAGHGWEDICHDAAVLAAHLAARVPGWPGDEVHVRAWPQIDFIFKFVAAPRPLKAMPQLPPDQMADRLADSAPDAALAARLGEMAAKMRGESDDG